ncbi:hypothetical protein J2129_001111 [Methanofollis sp. W23]|uniref:hypothetical protein n=1 Tax=Methanofollis sp. W23 TaxID=2817849 RepID=UPI001AE0F75B|nr:hypothetical protein [Methanofollis sp. W23]MBP2145657.1 hypothetical protein [Methanofollis sp. W23]
MTPKKSHPNIKLGPVLLSIAILLFVAFAGYGLYREIKSTDHPYSIHLSSVNESETGDGVIVHLTEEDFERWPFLGEAVKGESSNPYAPELTNSSRRSEFTHEYIYNGTLDRPIYLEYEGNYFKTWISVV